MFTMEDLAGHTPLPTGFPVGTIAAEQQQTAAATVRPVAARWKHKQMQGRIRGIKQS
jgi:hypothetical protein